MAVDEALTEAVDEGKSDPAVRLYGFSPPTLSLGRFQRIKDGFHPELLNRDGITLVRRPTGGHAVLHDDELTYSVVLSKKETEEIPGLRRADGSGGSFSKRAVYRFIARILVQGLRNLGVTGVINESRTGDLRNPDCFASSGEYEISSASGRKLIGSAQMTTRKSALQHGSIPITNPGGRVFRYIERTSGDGSTVSQEPPPPSSLAEETGRGLTFEEVRDAFARAFRSEWETVDSTLTSEEEKSARQILSAKYDTDAWNLAY
jgi:lipoate-protein ligase A